MTYYDYNKIVSNKGKMINFSAFLSGNIEGCQELKNATPN